MTWLAPLYLAGALAVAAPILFHLWRRVPRGQRTFSTLMFLTPSPPRVTSLSKVEHWLLLALRALALALLALAFARPVLRVPATIPIAPDETEFVAILIDTSASLQQLGLWEQVEQKLNDRLKKLPESAVIGLFRFDEPWSTLVSFSEAESLGSAANRTLVQERLRALKPTWQGTRLGEGLARTAQAVQEAQAGRTLPCPQRVWLVSDLQSGSDLAALREFDWPDDLPVEWIALQPKSGENAGLQLVAAAVDSADDRLRVRVSNAATSTPQQFQLTWGDAEATPCLGVTVPPGESRVVALPTPPTIEAGQSVLLTGDQQSFDNRLWLPVRQPRQCYVLYLGDDAADDPNGLRYYFDRAVASNPRYEVTVLTGDEPVLSNSRPALILATEATPEARDLLPKLHASGTDVLLVGRSAEGLRSLLELCDLKDLRVEEAATEQYALWSQIDFESRWFAPFAEAQFADFSGIHFWKHRRVLGDLPSATETLVRFDDGDPAVLQFAGTSSLGKTWCFTSGWHPKDSQLSRSSKFVPLMWQVLETALGETSPSSSQLVGQSIRRTFNDKHERIVVLPDGSEQPWPVTTGEFTAVSQPGRYRITGVEPEEVIAVNLAPDESRTAPMPLEELEAAGLKLSTSAARPSVSTTPEQLRQQQLAELEERQQLWRWILLGALGLLILETVLAARRGSTSLASTSEVTA